MTGVEATSVTNMGGSFLQLGVDGTYSMAMWGLSFVTANFVLILVTIALGAIIVYAKRKIGGAKKGGSVV